MKKLKNNMSPESLSYLRKRFEETLEAKSGFIILMNDQHITDFYYNVCPDCVIKITQKSVNDFNKLYGLPVCSNK